MRRLTWIVVAAPFFQNTKIARTAVKFFRRAGDIAIKFVAAIFAIRLAVTAEHSV